MNQIKNNKNYIFFFYIDCIEENESNYFKINNFFHSSEILCHNKYFSIFEANAIDFDFLEKNDKLISFFLYMNKFFFRNQKKNLKLCLLQNILTHNVFECSTIPFFLNMFFFFRHIYFFIFLLKKLSFNKKLIIK
jgi:hypothetical protein